MNSEPNTTPDTLLLLTAQEAADYLRIPLGSLYVRIHKKEIPCTRLGRLLRFRRSELDGLMVPGQVQTSAPEEAGEQATAQEPNVAASQPTPGASEEADFEPLKAS